MCFWSEEKSVSMSRALFEKRYEQIGGRVVNVRPVRCIRVNTRRISSENLAKRLVGRGVKLSRIPFVSDGFYVRFSPFNLVSCPEYLLGLFFIQDAVSQIPAEVLGVSGGVVLDACAAPGGKSMQLACFADVVVSVDAQPARFEKFELNLIRMGHRNCLGYCCDVLDLSGCFDYVLVDAPCSGNYVLEQNWFSKNSLKRVQQRSEIQKELLSHVVQKCVKPGGVVVYSTCSLEPEEDEGVLQYVLDEVGGIELEEMDVNVGSPGLSEAFGVSFDPSLKYARRFWPHELGSIGFFVGRLRKR